MITLNNNLSKIDYEFASFFLKILLYKREKKDPKEYEKILVNLAEQGQIESIEYYFSTLPNFACLNTKIVSNIFKIEKKFIKYARDYRALFAYERSKMADSFYNKKIENVEELPQNSLCRIYYNASIEMLTKIARIDCIASEHLYKLKNSAKSGTEEYLRELSNYRNKLYALANKQISEDKRIKYLYAYVKNVLQYASEIEFRNKINLVNKTIGDIQKNCLVLNGAKRTE